MHEDSEYRGEVTDLLRSWAQGDATAEERLMAAVYTELAGIASNLLRRERVDHTLDPPSLVHEAYLRLIPQRGTPWKNRTHFFAIAAKMMRRVLWDHAKAHERGKRGGDLIRVVFHAESGPAIEREACFSALEEALRALAARDPRKAAIVELRFFGGLSVPEAAEALDCSQRTVARDWRLAKAWLLRELT